MNPVSSNNVRVDGLMKPDAMKVCDDNLNTWLKWLVDKQGEIDWKTVDISCLTQYDNICDKNLKTIIELLISRVCALQTTLPGDCAENTSCCDIVESNITLLDRWGNQNNANPAKATIQNGWVKLSGRINSGSTLLDIMQLPLEATPAFEKQVPFAFSFSLPNNFNEHPRLKITTSGVVSMVWSGSSPVSTLNGDIFLDGITYKL